MIEQPLAISAAETELCVLAPGVWLGRVSDSRGMTHVRRRHGEGADTRSRHVPAGRVHKATCVSRSCRGKAQPRAAGHPGAVAHRDVISGSAAAGGPLPALPASAVAAARGACDWWPVTAVAAVLSHGVLPFQGLCLSAPNCPPCPKDPSGWGTAPCTRCSRILLGHTCTDTISM